MVDREGCRRLPDWPAVLKIAVARQCSTMRAAAFKMSQCGEKRRKCHKFAVSRAARPYPDLDGWKEMAFGILRSIAQES
ncbi:hypothetical protein [Rhizobium sp. TRM95796]|uniref:hypothetical protein n=1 Tax=Rhizobium sp. TRM95796 TaxID=2979862 RepID=UPI0021E80230|nr:hypothetical protein [Rhizobium sp. TRM95796]MCV3765005.1 hypothetical protein [Rhizobium sp. TRM95796]